MKVPKQINVREQKSKISSVLDYQLKKQPVENRKGLEESSNENYPLKNIKNKHKQRNI